MNPFAPDAFTLPKAVLVGILTVVVLGAWALEGVGRGRLKVARTPIDRPLAVYFGLLTLATLFSANVSLSIFGPYKWREGLVFLLSYGALFWASATYLKGAVLRRALLAGALSALGVSVYAIAQRLGFDFTAWYGPVESARAFATLGNPVYLGAYTVLVVPVALGVALGSHAGSPRRSAAAAVAVLCTVAAAGSFSRGAWVGLAGALAFMLVFAPAAKRRSLALMAAVLAGVLLLTAAMPAAGRAQDVGARLRSIVEVGGTNTPRVVLWKKAVLLAVRHPLLGVGPEAFKQEFAQVKPSEWPAIDPEDKSARAHSDLLHVAATAGIPAALAYLVALAILVGRSAWVLGWPAGSRTAFGEGEGVENRRMLVAGMAGAMVGYLAFLQVNFTMVDVTPLFWLTAGAVVAMTHGLGTTRPARRWVLPEALSGQAFRYVTFGLISVAVLWGVSVFAKQAIADVYFGEALAHESGGRLVEGVSDLRRAIGLSPREDYYQFFLGKAYVIAAQQREDPRLLGAAVDAYEKARALNRADPTLLNAIGSAYYIGATRFNRQGDLDRAEYNYKRTLLLDRTNVDALHRLGQIAFLRQKYGMAASYFEQVISLNPDESSYHYNLGAAYENLGELDKALAAYRKSAELEPRNEQAKQAAAAVKKRMGRRRASAGPAE